MFALPVTSYLVFLLGLDTLQHYPFPPKAWIVSFGHFLALLAYIYSFLFERRIGTYHQSAIRCNVLSSFDLAPVLGLVPCHVARPCTKVDFITENAI